jgi:hypothetical protein
VLLSRDSLVIGNRGLPAALGTALTLPPDQKTQAVSAAQERQDFFARRLQEAYGIHHQE